jgi:hypothetical protein
MLVDKKEDVMSLTDAWTDWKDWLLSLSPEFAFLLALPFLVACAAFLKHWLTRPRVGGRAPNGAIPGRRA